MAEGHGIADMVAFWQDSQRAFWNAAAAQPAFADADAFAPPDWQAFDSLLEELIGAVTPETQTPAWRQATAAAAQYRDVIAAAWARIQSAFEAHRRAIHDPAGAPPDWRLLRDRWFQIAEAEFIKTQRSADFLTAQRNAIRAAIALWTEVPEPMREMIRSQRVSAQTAYRTLVDLGMTGVPIAQTPKEMIWQDGQTTLSRYLPIVGAARTLGPVLICHGLIGRQTMTDLRPERSMVRNLLASGVDVFVIDWGNAGPEHAGLGLDHFAGTQLRACLERALAASGEARLVLFGICQGGTLAACHAACFGDLLSGLILGVAPIDFHADIHDPDPAHGLLNLWVRSLEDEDLEGLIGMEGNLSGTLLGAVFNQLNPVRTLAKYAIEMVETATDPAALMTFLAMEKWLADRPDLPGALARTWLIDLYRNNALVSGELRLCGQSVRLEAIDVPVLNIFAIGDHIIPPPCSRALGRRLKSGLSEELALPTGHIGAFVSAKSQTVLGPGITDWLRRHT